MTKNLKRRAESIFFFDEDALGNEDAIACLERKCFFEVEKFSLQWTARNCHFKRLSSLREALRRGPDFIEVGAYCSSEAISPNLRLKKGAFWDCIQYITHDLPERDFFEDFLAMPSCNGGRANDLMDLRQAEQETESASFGRQEHERKLWWVPGLMYGSAWWMWFARRAFDYFPRERILAFKDCEVVEETQNGGVFLQLYPDVRDFAKAESRVRQEKLKEWLDFDGAEARGNEYQVYESGRLPSGRTYLITWVDPDGTHVPRMEATHAVITWQAGSNLLGDRHEPKDVAVAIADDPSVLDGPLEPDLAVAAADSRFDLRLISYPGNKVQVIRALATTTGASLSEAKRLVERAPCYVLVNRSANEIQRARAAFEDVGVESFVHAAKAGAREGQKVASRMG